MDLPILLKPTTNKPGLDIYVNSVNANSFSISGSSEFKGNLSVLGSLSSSNYSPGEVLIGSGTQSIAVVAGTGGGSFCYNRLLNKAIGSGLSGVNTAFSTTNGFSTMTQITGPSSNPTICYSPELNIYTCIDGAGTAVNTSTDAITWTARPALPVTAGSYDIVWIPQVSQFFTTSVTGSVLSSFNGITWFNTANARLPYTFAYGTTAAGVGRIVAVGDGGSSYSDNGGTSWLPSALAASTKMSWVCYSPHWKRWCAVPRTGTITSIFNSVDGINWVQTTGVTAFTGNTRTICWCQELMVYVAAGDGDLICVSQDGYTWRKVQTSGTGPASYGCKWIPEWGQFVCGGISGYVRVSPKLWV